MEFLNFFLIFIREKKDTMISLKSLISESIDIVKQFRNAPNDSWNETMIKMVLMRKISGKTAVYRLEKDNWFRRFENPGKGYGIMIRGIKISKTPIKVSSNWAVGPNQVVLNALITYLPNQFDNVDDDIPQNYVTDKGLIILGTKQMNGFEMMQVIKPKDIEDFIKVNMSSYKP